MYYKILLKYIFLVGFFFIRNLINDNFIHILIIIQFNFNLEENISVHLKDTFIVYSMIAS